MTPDIVKVYPDEFVDDELKCRGNGYYYYPLEIVYQDNFWPDKPVVTRLEVQWAAIPKLIEQLQLAQQLDKLMCEIEMWGLADMNEKQQEDYQIMLERAKLVSNELKAINGGDPLDTPWLERKVKQDDSPDDDLEEDDGPK